ncbi:MAG: hypothetical protein K2J95_10505, partial [Lachnospiraceae bacterium]|nr:hypothetical protein [Lachnospiraceae bacterium]
KTVILYYFNGLPIDEIADIMECPPGTVMYRLSVARAKIRDGVDAYENKSGDKLYSVVGLPLLMRLLYEEADSMAVPDMLHGIMEAIRSHLAAGAVAGAAAAGETAGTTASAAAAGEAAGTTGSAAAAGEAVQNTIGGIVNGIKGGIMKAGMNTLIAKIGIAAAVVAIISAGAVFITKNSGEEEVSNGGTGDVAQEQTAGSETGSDDQGQTVGSETGSDVQGQTANEAPECLNGEINDMVEEDQKMAERVALLETLDYPEGVLPYGEYVCYEIMDIQENNDLQSPLYFAPVAFSVFLIESEYFQYEYDAETKQYTIWDTYQDIGGKNDYTAFDHKYIGHLDEGGNFIVTHYERTNYKQIYAGWREDDGIIYPCDSEWRNIVLDDIEWVFVYSIDEVFIEKQYISVDLELCRKIRNAVVTAMMDPEVLCNADPATMQAIADLDNEQDIYSLLSGSDEFTQTVRRVLGVTSADELTLRSHNASGVLPVSAIRIMRVPDRNTCAVWIEGSDASGLQGADPEAMYNISIGDKYLGSAGIGQ